VLLSSFKELPIDVPSNEGINLSIMVPNLSISALFCGLAFNASVYFSANIDRVLGPNLPSTSLPVKPIDD
jgi:hypothetical protein